LHSKNYYYVWIHLCFEIFLVLAMFVRLMIRKLLKSQ
jgi:hypothetical protein